MATTKARIESAEQVIRRLMSALRDADAAQGLKPAWTEERPEIEMGQKWLGGLMPGSAESGRKS